MQPLDGSQTRKAVESVQLSPKARELELVKLDDKSTNSGDTEPSAQQKRRHIPGGGEETTPVTTAGPEAGK